MLMKMKQFITAMLVLVMSVSILAVPASAETEALTAKINVAVKIDGYQPEQKDTYEIHVVPGSSNFPMPSGGEGGVYKILGQGTKELVFNYQGLGVYTYTITQGTCGNGDCYHDESVYYLTVYVLNAEKPTAEHRFDVIAVLKLDGGNDADKPETALFTNKYAKPAEITLTATKTYNGKTPKTNQFDFRLRDGSGNTLETVSNVGKNVTFSPIVLDETGTYTYKISEVTGDRSYIIYDKSIYTATVVVTRDVEKQGNYEAAVRYQKGTKACDADDLIFVNKSETGGLPFTGDTFRLTMWVSIMGISLTGVLVLAAIWLKKRKNGR